MSSVVSAFHLYPEDCKYQFILLPVGLLYNVPIRRAKKGDIFEFYDGEKVVIEAVEVKLMQDVYVDCKLRYGISIHKAIRKWQDYATVRGEDVNVISTDRCLKVWYKKL